MTKPADVPQDVWEKAELCFPGNAWNPLAIERTARAIMAEREANSQVTGAMVDAGAHVLEKRFGMGQPWEELCEMSDAVLQAALTQA